MFLGDGLDNPQGSSELSNTECRQEGDYDILPSRNRMSLKTLNSNHLK